MKQTILILLVGLTLLTSCDKDEKNEPTKEKPSAFTGATAMIDATSYTDWNYYSLSEKKLVGKGAEDSLTNQAWFARNDWDFAVKRYEVRTNSGAASSINSQGGVYTFADGIDFHSATALPAGASFEVDQAVTEAVMAGGEKTTIKSKAQVVLLKKNDDGSFVMPPVFLPSPLYAFRSADGQKVYKLTFTQYKDEEGTSGKVKFGFEEIE